MSNNQKSFPGEIDAILGKTYSDINDEHNIQTLYNPDLMIVSQTDPANNNYNTKSIKFVDLVHETASYDGGANTLRQFTDGRLTININLGKMNNIYTRIARNDWLPGVKYESGSKVYRGNALWMSLKNNNTSDPLKTTSIYQDAGSYNIGGTGWLLLRDDNCGQSLSQWVYPLNGAVETYYLENNDSANVGGVIKNGWKFTVGRTHSYLLLDTDYTDQEYAKLGILCTSIKAGLTLSGIQNSIIKRITQIPNQKIIEGADINPTLVINKFAGISTSQYKGRDSGGLGTTINTPNNGNVISHTHSEDLWFKMTGHFTTVKVNNWYIGSEYENGAFSLDGWTGNSVIKKGRGDDWIKRMQFNTGDRVNSGQTNAQGTRKDGDIKNTGEAYNYAYSMGINYGLCISTFGSDISESTDVNNFRAEETGSARAITDKVKHGW